MIEKKSSVKGMGYFNLLKGSGLLLIIWGHSAGIFTAAQSENGRLASGIYSILGGGIMAMFFMISGYQFYKRSPKKCLHIQKRMLLYPYGLTAAAVLLSKGLLAVLKRRPFMEHGGEYLLTYLLGLNAEGGGLLWGIPVESVSILWFVLALFGGWMIYNEIMQCKSQQLQWSLIGLCAVFAWLLGRFSRVWVFCLPQSLAAVFFLAAGAEIRRRQLLEKALSWKAYLLIGILLAICAGFGRVDMVNSVWKLGLMDIAGSACCGFLLLKGYDYLMRHVFEKKRLRHWNLQGFIRCGSYACIAMKR